MDAHSHKPTNLPKFLRWDADKGFFLDWRQKLPAGERRRQKTLGFIPKAQALLAHARLYEDMLAKRLGFEKEPEYTLQQAIESFLVYSRGNKKTWDDDEMISAQLLAYFGNVPLASLDLDQVERYKQDRKAKFLEKHEREMAPGTLNRHLACLKTIVNKALQARKLAWNPILGLKLARENSARDRVLSQEEFRKLLEACSEHLKPIVLLAYYTGMRRSEMTGLRWDQVDFRNKVIRLEASDTKTGERREVPLNDGFLAMLASMPKIPNSPAVFHWRGEPFWRFSTAFNAACRRAKISNFRFHDLRHCAITNFRKAGVADKVIMSISGHKTAAVFRRYDSVDRDDKKAALAKVGDFLETLRQSRSSSQAA
jgi:integrase